MPRQTAATRAAATIAEYRVDHCAVLLSETENLAKVREAYNAAYAGLKRGPKNMNELTPYLKKVGNPDELLRSRSGEPYEIVWGVNPRGFSKQAESPIVIAYEKTGVGGKHYVATAMGVVILSDEELARVIGAQKG